MKKFGEVATASRPKKILNEVNVSTAQGAQAWFEAMLRRARSEGIFIVEETLTNPLARLLLENNDANRPVVPTSVAEMAKAMKEQAFEGLNGETLKVSICGQLNDGQHRCHARLEAGVDVAVLFMFGLPRESRLTIDQGRQRRAFDYVAMDGRDAPSTLTNVANLLYLWRTYKTISPRDSQNRLGRSQVAEYAKSNYDQIMASCNDTPRKGCNRIGGTTLVAFCHLIFTEKNPAAASDFIARLVNGNGLDEKSPILVARRKLMVAKRIPKMERFEIIVKAWNYHRAGQETSNILIRKVIPEISK